GSRAGLSRAPNFFRMNPCRRPAPSRPPAPPRASGSGSQSVEFDVLVLDRQVVDAAVGRGDPARHLAGLGHALHERMHKRLVRFGRDPVVELILESQLIDELSVRRHGLSSPCADRAAEAGGGEGEPERVPGALDLAVPALETDLAVLE